jgi:hypothetical protein
MDAKEFIKRREDEVEDLCENWPKSYWAHVMEQYHKQRQKAGQHETIVIGLKEEMEKEAEKLSKQDDWYSEERLKGYNDAISDFGVACRELGYTKKAL